MAYTPFHADWEDYPSQDTPITAAALEYIESGLSTAAATADEALSDAATAQATADAAIAKSLVDAKGDLIVGSAADTAIRKAVGSDNQVLAASAGDTGGVTWKQVTNAMVDASAAIAYSKLNLGTSIVNADIATNAAIARTKLATTTRKVTPGRMASSDPVNNVWPDAATQYLELFLQIPDDYVSGDLTFKILRRAGGTSGTAVMRKSTYRTRESAAISVIDNAVNINYTPSDTNSNLLTATVAAANFQAGDVIRMQISRLGSDGSDNLAQPIQFDGAWVEYLGYV